MAIELCILEYNVLTTSVPDGMELIVILVTIVVAMWFVGFDLGALLEEDHIPSGVTSLSTTGIFGRLMPTVFTPEGRYRLIPAWHGNRCSIHSS